MKKRRFPRLNHPWAKSAAGFTLVELIVVIAIMGVLAGGATVGYSGYMKSAQKKADMTTVSNITRAIEVASKSHAFRIDPVLQMEDSEVEIPVGFIVLTNDDASTSLAAIQSDTGTTATSASEPCKIVRTPKQLYRVEPDGTVTVKQGCDNKEVPVYKFVPDGQVSNYCSTHSKFVEQEITMANGTNATKTGKNVVTNRSNIAMEGSVHIDTQVPSQEIYDYSGNAEFSPATEGTLHEILVATYGPNYAKEVRLTSPDWRPTSLTSFFSGTADLWESVQYIANMLYDVVGNGTSVEVPLLGISFDLIGDNHESSADLVYDVSKVITAMPEETFIGWWNDAPEAPLRNGFGFGGREYYTAVRIAYNHGFSTYVQSQGSSPNGIGPHNGDYIAHANAIADYSESSASLAKEAYSSLENLPDEFIEGALNAVEDGAGDMSMPMSICNAAFTDPKSQLDDSVKNCATCKALYAQYTLEGGPCEENGRAFYATMKQAAKTDVGIVNENGGETFFDYYSGYLKEFQGLYSAVNEYTTDKSAIVIAVSYKNDQLHYDVAPFEADARNS